MDMTAHRHPDDRNAFPGEASVGTLLGIWAHPDDEAYLSAGLMFRAREAGHRVVVATATRGELGTDDPRAWTPDRLSAARETEMTASLAAVDVHEHLWLGYRDGTLPEVRAGAAVGQITALIAVIRPDTIVTFGPDGMTGHPDHRTVSRWVTLAWEATGRGAQLWYSTLTPEFHREWGALNADVGLWFEGSAPPSDPVADLAQWVRCDGELSDRKFAALAAHTSQTSGLIALVGAERYRQWWSAEYFVDARARIDRQPAA